MKEFTLVLKSSDVGQLLDGLMRRVIAWRKTADFMETGYTDDPTFVCEECSDAGEATRIADHFATIAATIERQVTEQGGWKNS